MRSPAYPVMLIKNALAGFLAVKIVKTEFTAPCRLRVLSTRIGRQVPEKKSG